jgi:hypothetical protein
MYVHKALTNDRRVKTVSHHHQTGSVKRIYFVYSRVNLCNCVITINQQHRFFEMQPVAGHCAACASVFADSLPLTRTFLQRARLVSQLRVRSADNPGCLVCYRQGHMFPTTNEVCRRCLRRHEREGGVIIWLLFLLRGHVGGDIGRLIVRLIVN